MKLIVFLFLLFGITEPWKAEQSKKGKLLELKIDYLVGVVRQAHQPSLSNP